MILTQLTKYHATFKIGRMYIFCKYKMTSKQSWVMCQVVHALWVMSVVKEKTYWVEGI